MRARKHGGGHSPKCGHSLTGLSIKHTVSGKPDVLDCAPHFEKMLYDNAQLARVYLHAWQVTGNAFFRTITEEILDYIVREMTDPGGGFYSTQDADSEGEEGKFFVWTPGEIRAVLGDEADAFMKAYNVTPDGNFEGKNILEFVGDLKQHPTMAEARRKLFEAREKRIHPGRDEKVLTSWNGLMLAAFADAARALGRDDYQQIAERNADFLLRELRQDNGRLLRTWKRGKAKLNGYLEDHAYFIEGLLELYQTTFEPSWFVAAQELVGRLTQTSPLAGAQAREPLDHERHENSTKLAKGEYPFRGFRPFRDIRGPNARH